MTAANRAGVLRSLDSMEKALANAVTAIDNGQGDVATYWIGEAEKWCAGLREWNEGRPGDDQ